MKASESHPRLKSLKADLKAFRSQSRPHTRIPEHLRRAALEAIAPGLNPSHVERIKPKIKINFDQLGTKAAIRWSA